MSKTDELGLFAQYVGEKVNFQRLEPIAKENGKGYGKYADCKEYIISHIDYYEFEAYKELFGLTPLLIERWDYRGIDFSIYLYIRGDIIVGGRVFKYVETSSGYHFRSAGYEINATQQELRVVRRILSHITVF